MGEPWIRVHAGVASKPVVWRAVEALGVSQAEAVGLLVSFWGSVSQFAANGAVSHLPDAQLEAWAGWTRKRGKFAAFLRAHHLDADGRVNEWDDYAGALETRRAKDRERKRNSSGVPAEFQQNSAPARANETKRDETKQEPSPSSWRPSLEPALAERLPSDHDRNALSAVLHQASNRLAWVAELTAMLDGMAGHVPATPAQLGEALRDFAANRDPSQKPNLRHFRAYIERIVQAPTPPPTGGAGVPSAPRRSPPSAGGRAALLVGEIRGLIEQRQQPGQSTIRFIPRAKVEALGADVLRAYEAIGGADRFIAATGDAMSFVIRDFSQALEATHG